MSAGAVAPGLHHTVGYGTSLRGRGGGGEHLLCNVVGLGAADALFKGGVCGHRRRVCCRARILAVRQQRGLELLALQHRRHADVTSALRLQSLCTESVHTTNYASFFFKKKTVNFSSHSVFLRSVLH